MKPKLCIIIFSLLLFFVFVQPIKAQQPCPDLIIQKITISPQNPTLGSTVKIKVVVKNIGLRGTPKTTKLSIELVGKRRFFQIPILGPSGVQIVNHNVRIIPASNYKIVAKVNRSPRLFPECNPNNNGKVLSFKLACPDPAIVSFKLSGKARYRPGEVMLFKVGIKNLGILKSAPTVLTLYLKDKPQKRVNIPSLKPNKTHSVTINLGVQATFKNIFHPYQITNQKKWNLKAEVRLKRIQKECNMWNNRKKLDITITR